MNNTPEVTFVPQHIAEDINLSEWFAEGVVKGDTIGISIRHPDEPLLFTIDDGWYTYVFDDAEIPVSGLTMFDMDMAQGIIKAVEGFNTVVVHCTAGMSRSAAVAKWLADNKGFKMFIHPYGVGTDKHYNKHVYRTLDACIGKDMASYYESLERDGRMMMKYWED